MKRKTLILPFLIWTAACSAPCRDGEGAVTSHERKLEGFTIVEVSAPVEVVIRKGNSGTATVTAQDNIAELITTEVSGHKLLIESKQCFNTHERVRVELDAAQLEGLTLAGSGSLVVADTFQSEKMRISLAGSGTLEAKIIAAKLETNLSGSGKATLTGSANDVSFSVAGSGNIDASAMPCNRAEADIGGSGDMKIYAIEKLRASIAGSGNIHYKGNPQVKSDISGSGKVVSDN